MTRPLTALAALAALAAVAALAAMTATTALAASATEALPSQRRVLLLGNSLTYENELPRMVEWISRRGGERPMLVVEEIAVPNAALEDHWRDGRALVRIESGDFDDVVLQQGPSALPGSRSSLVGWATKFASRIRAAGARPVLFMVWPALDRPQDGARVEASYSSAARAADGLLLPVGTAWRLARKSEPALSLYGPDRFHPTALGSYLAAIVIEAALSGRPPQDGAIDLELAQGRLQVEAQRARQLAHVAALALAER